MAGRRVRRLVVVPELFELADPPTAAMLSTQAERFADEAGLQLDVCKRGLLGDLDVLFASFRSIQMYEAWQLHGDWVGEHHDALGFGIAERFDNASLVQLETVNDAREWCLNFRDNFAGLLGVDGYLLQPTASGPAPAIDLEGVAKDDLRRRTMMLTAPAGLAGAPVVSMPIGWFEGLPVGLAVVGLPGDDEMVIDLALGMGKDA